MRVVVTGATGNVGRHVVAGLLAEDVSVRAVTRRPAEAQLPGSAEVVSGDLDDPRSLADTLAGADALYLLSTGGTAGVAAAARVAGVRRIVLLSSASAGFEQEDAGGAFHLAAEEAVESRSSGWTHLRPGMFASNLMDWSAPIKEFGAVQAPYDGALQAPVDERDVAEVAVRALLSDEHLGRRYTLTGPEALSKSQQVAALAEGTGRDIDFVELTPDQWRAQASHYMPTYAIDWLLAYWERTTRNPERVDPTLGHLLGRPATRLAEWAERNREAFL